jgi:hypothetical protein
MENTWSEKSPIFAGEDIPLKLLEKFTTCRLDGPYDCLFCTEDETIVRGNCCGNPSFVSFRVDYAMVYMPEEFYPFDLDTNDSNDTPQSKE